MIGTVLVLLTLYLHFTFTLKEWPQIEEPANKKLINQEKKTGQTFLDKIKTNVKPKIKTKY